MSDQRCPSDEELQAFGNMQLGDSDFARVSSHLALCGTCRSSIRRHREGIDLGETIDTRDTGFQEGQPDSRDQAGDDPRPVSTSQPTQQSVLTALAESLERPPSISLSPDESRQGSDAAGQGSKNESSRGFWGPPESNPRYELQDEIARGGMGAILRAKDKDLGRNIAVKVLLDQHKVKPKVIQRFIEEAQIGGQLQHPGIAPVYELGQFADQRPFFSMKLVKGETLSSLLKMRKDLGEERAKFIGVFEQICQTVAYAHSRGVIHRDLKPGNIMVGAFGEVQVMDWGLAKVLQQDASGSENEYSEDVAEQSIIHTPRRAGETTAGDAGDAGGSDALQTVMGTVMGTPSFMPPEQALGRIDIMDERADVFGLGAILCQILTGEPPYLGKNTNTILESARIGALDQCFKRLDTSQADNDLIQIAKDCLQMQPEDRPRDASVLAVRITEYIESVETKLQASEVERATEAARADDEKKLRRISLVMAGAVLLLGAVGMIMQHLHAGELEALNGKLLVQARTEMRLRNVAVAAKDKAEAAEKESRIARLKADSSRADSELARSESEAVSEFLIGLFEDADPIARTERAFGAQRRGEGELLAVEVVNRGRNKLKTELLTQPRVRAVLLDKIGNVYLSIGKVDDGEALMREAAILRLEEFGPQSLEYAETLESLGVLNLYRHDLEAANDAFTKSLAIRRSTPSKNKLLIAKTLLNLGVMHSLRADYELAEPFLKECLQLRLDYYQKDGVPSDHMDVATVQFLLGKVYIVKDELENARTLLQQAATTTDRLQGNNGFSAILSLFTQAQMLEKLGTFGKANALAAYQQMDEKAVKLFGEEHLLVAFGRSFFGKFLYANKEYEQAIAMFRYVIRIYERELGPNSTVIAQRLIDLTRALRYAGQREAAKESIRKSAQIFRSLETPHRSGVDHAVSLHIYGAVLDDLGDREQGKQLLLESFESLHKNELKTSSRGTMLARDYAAMLLTFEVAGPTFRAHLGTGETAEINFELATKWAGAIDAQKKASEALSATEILMQERFENQAVLRLTDAVAAGFNDKSQIEENPAFNSVKDRADFQALLKTIAE